MKISRRKSLWTIVGGIFAPTIGNSSSDKLSFPTSPISTGYGLPEETAKANIDPFWKQNEISRLQKIVSGEFDKYQLRELEAQSTQYMTQNANIDSLKSISYVHKIKMQYDAHIERLKKTWKQSAMQRINELMEQK